MNVVILTGRLTREPELKALPGGTMLANFSIAVKRDRQRDKVDFIDCTAWGKTAETIATHFTKGSGIVVNGALQIDNYEKDGEKRKVAKVNVNNFNFPEGGQTKDSSEGPFNEPVDEGNLPW